MKTVPDVNTYIRESSAVTVVPKLIAEWNMNRYAHVIADNTPSEDEAGYDIEKFPIESIYEGLRPTAGINKAFVGASYVSENYITSVPDIRYYIASVDDKYKYWVGPQLASGTVPYNFPLHTDSITVVRPQIRYYEEDATTTKLVTVNKLVIGIENSVYSPDDWDVQIRNSGGSWVTVSTNPTIPSNGQVSLWYDGAAWTTTQNLNEEVQISGVRLIVRSMNAANARFSLIELSARLERDLSADVVSVEDTFNLGEVDLVTPIGTISSNTATIELFNETLNYSSDNLTGPYYGLLDKNVKFTLTYEYDVAGGTVQQFVMYSDAWEDSDSNSTATVKVGDASKFLQDIKPPKIVRQNVPVQEAIWRICDSVGFNDYVIETIENEPSSIIDIFWTTGQDTVWEVFSELSRGTQCAIYFDAYGRLRVKTRQAAFQSASTPVWTAREDASGAEQPDIISVDSESVYESNKVVINYTPTSFSEEKDGVAAMEVVWEPEGTVALRAADLQSAITSGSTHVWLSPSAVKTWPFEGIVQIEGEYIRYSGKSYTYYDGAVKTSAVVKSKEEEVALAANTPDNKKHLNLYSGALVISERGLWNTQTSDHLVDIAGWSKSFVNNYGTVTSPCAGVTHNIKDSTLSITSKSTNNQNDYRYFHKGNGIDDGYLWFGTKMKLDRGSYKDNVAGIFFNAGVLGRGYYIEVTPSAKLNGKDRAVKNEVLFYSMKSDGTKKNFGGETAKIKDKSKDNDKAQKKTIAIGAEAPVVEGQFFELDVQFFEKPSGDHLVLINYNGSLVLEANIPNGSEWQHDRVSRFGGFVRGYGKATYEYMYGIANQGATYIDAPQFFDRIENGYYGQQWIRDWTYETRTVTKKVKKKSTQVLQRYNQRLFDEFGPIVHEIRELDVKFIDDRPVLQSRLFSTNSTQVVCPEYTANAFGAKFILANASRTTAIVNGDDNLSSIGNTINQRLLVFGRAVIQKTAGKVTKQDDWSINRRGEIEVEFDNKWIQSKEEAESLGEWIISQWARKDTGYDVEIFGNPLLELTDVVALQFRDMTPSEDKFFITEINTSFNNGITTQLKLRRV